MAKRKQKGPHRSPNNGIGADVKQHAGSDNIKEAAYTLQAESTKPPPRADYYKMKKTNSTKGLQSLLNIEQKHIHEDLPLGALRATTFSHQKSYLGSMDDIEPGLLLVLPRVPHHILLSIQQRLSTDEFKRAFEDKQMGYTPVAIEPIEHPLHESYQDDEMKPGRENGGFLYSFQNTKDYKNETRFRIQPEDLQDDEDDDNESTATGESRPPRLNNYIMLARECGAANPGASTLFDYASSSALSELNALINKLFRITFPEMQKADAISDGPRVPYSSFILKEGNKKMKLDDVELAYDVNTGYMKRGSENIVEGMMGIMRTDTPYLQHFHTDCQYGRIRAEALRNINQEELECKSYKVGYLFHMPLNLEGSILSVLVKYKKKWTVMDIHIPFGSALFTRMDVYHAGFLGTPGSYRLSGVVITPNSMYTEAGDYAMDDASIPKEAFTNFAAPRPQNIQDFTEWCPLNLLGEHTKSQIGGAESILQGLHSLENISIFLKFMGLPKPSDSIDENADAEDGWKMDTLREYKSAQSNKRNKELKDGKRPSTFVRYKHFMRKQEAALYEMEVEKAKTIRKARVGFTEPSAQEVLKSKYASSPE